MYTYFKAKTVKGNHELTTNKSARVLQLLKSSLIALERNTYNARVHNIWKSWYFLKFF